MPQVTICKARSRAELLDISARCMQRAHEDTRAVRLIVPDSAWETDRKLMLCEAGTLGVSVQTYPHWLEETWGLHGDGRAIVSTRQRRILLRALAGQFDLLESQPSPALIESLAAFAEEAAALFAPGNPACELPELSASERKVMALVVEYLRTLEEHALIEPAQAEQLLPLQLLAAYAYVFEAPAGACAHERRFVERLGAHADVTVIEQALPEGAPAEGDELACLRTRLFTGQGGLAASGQVCAGEAAGFHAMPVLLVKMIERLAAAGAAYSDIAVVFAHPQSAHPHVHDALARAGIPFAGGFSVPFSQTGLGAALCDFLEFAYDMHSEASYAGLCSFLLSPYAGIDSDAARALQERWRARGGSTAQERLADMQQGFTEGRSTSTQVRRKLQPVAELMSADDAERIRLMFEHAQQARLPLECLIDDRQAAQAALDYVQACTELGVCIDPAELASVPVSLERSFGDVGNAVELTDTRALRLGSRAHVILADLDAVNFPMARKQRSFDGLAAKLGFGVPDDTALRQRLMLSGLLEAATESFGFYRSRNTAQGDESRQSALFDELMSAYRTPEDDERGLPIQELPAALAAHALRISEAEVFAAGERPHGVQPVKRGFLERDEAVELLVCDAAGAEREFSPTQIEDYYRCPYRWFSTRRTGYNALDRDFDQSALGTLFHDTMARFYPMLQERGHKRVTVENLPLALEIADEAFDAQVEESRQRPQKGLFVRTQQDRLQVEELREKLRAFIERDAAFLPGFTPSCFEVKLGGNGALEYATVPVRGSVDRIDMDDAGNAIVIDYKLSTLRQDYGLAKDLSAHDLNLHVQTDIYATLVQRHFELLGQHVNVVGSVYRSYTDNSLRGVYDKAIDWGALEEVKPVCDGLPRDEYPGGYKQYLGHVEETMARCMGRLAAGDIAPDPIADGVCAYCKALPFCPKGEADGAYR